MERCKTVTWHHYHFITRDISTACNRLFWWQCMLEHVCLPQITLSSPFCLRLCDRWHLEQFRRRICHLYPWQGQTCYLTCRTQSWRKDTNLAQGSIQHREDLIIDHCQSINTVFVQPLNVSLSVGRQKIELYAVEAAHLLIRLLHWDSLK